MNMKFLLPNFQVYAFPACDTTGGLILPRFLHTGLDAPATTISYLYLAVPASTRVPHYLNLSAGPHKVSVLRAESISRCLEGRTLRHTKPVSARAGAKPPVSLFPNIHV